MKKSFFTYKIFGFVCVLVSTIFCGCRNHYLLEESLEIGGNGGIEMRVSFDFAGKGPEDAIRTLRMFVFSPSEDGASEKMLCNKLYYAKDAVEVSEENKQPSFGIDPTTGLYTITDNFPKKDLKIILVANEPVDLSQITTIGGVKNIAVNYYDTYQDNIEITGIDDGSNKGFIPMFVETNWLTLTQWSALEVGSVKVGLVRTLAKITLQISEVNFANTEVKSASVRRVPRSSVLGDSTAIYEGDLIPTTTKAFTSTVTGGAPSDVLTFYVPGHALAPDNLGSYSYLQINAVNNGIVSTYKIPVCNGMGLLYRKDNPLTIDDLSATDLKISRNRHYQIQATVDNEGDIGVAKVEVKIKEWEIGDETDGEINPPNLVLSSIDFDYKKPGDEGINRIYFWTNQSVYSILDNVTVMPKDAGSEVKTIADVFVSAPTFTIFSDPSSLVYPINGFFDFELKDVYRTGHTITITFNAGGLKRTIIIRTPDAP